MPFSNHVLWSQSISPDDPGLPPELEGEMFDIWSDGLPRVSEEAPVGVLSMLGPSSMGIGPGCWLMWGSNNNMLDLGFHATCSSSSGGVGGRVAG